MKVTGRVINIFNKSYSVKRDKKICKQSFLLYEFGDCPEEIFITGRDREQKLVEKLKLNDLVTVDIRAVSLKIKDTWTTNLYLKSIEKENK